MCLCAPLQLSVPPDINSTCDLDYSLSPNCPFHKLVGRSRRVVQTPLSVFRDFVTNLVLPEYTDFLGSCTFELLYHKKRFRYDTAYGRRVTPL
jgi:hypothetical protein